MRGKGTKLGEGCPKVRLSQDSELRDCYVRDCYVWDCYVRDNYVVPKSSCLVPALAVAKFIIVKDMILVTLCCATRVGLR